MKFSMGGGLLQLAFYWRFFLRVQGFTLLAYLLNHWKMN